MRYWYLDPPEEPEPQDIQVTDEELADYFRDLGYYGEEITKSPPHATHCPHGKHWGECEHCDRLSDMAFDAARERRYFG